MRKLRIPLVVFLAIFMIGGLFATAATPAVPLAWAKDGQINCTSVWVSIKNDSGSHSTRYYDGYVKVNNATVYSVSKTSVAWNATATITWNPGTTVGSVEAHIAIYDKYGSNYYLQDSYNKTGQLNCAPPTSTNTPTPTETPIPPTDTPVPSHKVYICHVNPDHGQVLYVDENGWNGHDGHPLDWLIGETVSDEQRNQCENPATPTPVPVPGCMDPQATNYNPDATVDDGSCTYPPTDLCPNIEGVQETVPEGTIVDQDGNCVVPEGPTSTPQPTQPPVVQPPPTGGGIELANFLVPILIGGVSVITGGLAFGGFINSGKKRAKK